MMELNAKHYIGIPYKWGGREPSEGLDCFGLVLVVLRDLGIGDTDDEYADDMRQAIRKFTGIIATDGHGWVQTKGRLGDVVALGRNDRVHHVGIKVLGGMIHASLGNGVVRQPINRVMQWRGFDQVRYYRWVGHKDG